MRGRESARKFTYTATCSAVNGTSSGPTQDREAPRREANRSRPAPRRRPRRSSLGAVEPRERRPATRRPTRRRTRTSHEVTMSGGACRSLIASASDGRRVRQRWLWWDDAEVTLDESSTRGGPRPCGVEPLLERRATELGVRAGEQGTRLVEQAVRVGRIAHGLDLHRVTAPRHEQGGHIDQVFRAGTG